MANNYSQTSFILDCKTKEAAQDVMQYVAAWQTLEDGDEAVKHPAVTVDPDEDYYTGGDIDLDSETTLWFRDNGESFSTEFFERVITYAMFTHKLDPMGFTWANTCSKQRIDEFDGGAMFFHLDSDGAVVIDYQGGWGWVQAMKDKYKQLKVA